LRMVLKVYVFPRVRQSLDLFLDGEQGIGIQLPMIIHLDTPWLVGSIWFTDDSTGFIMSVSFTYWIVARFSPLDFKIFLGFPNVVRDIEVSKYRLPSFKEDVGKNPTEHLFEFHKFMDQLDIHHEDFLMKLFMFSLGGDARQWYKSLPHFNISSLKEFHAVFHKHCKRIYPFDFILKIVTI